mmetsp:Transcript_21192/g.42276  ORF Transcript_21192/g.42276 Transcript_21192/m.42276 type:complete len:206 (-) Transcript_21192:1859-2476(-)
MRPRWLRLSTSIKSNFMPEKSTSKIMLWSTSGGTFSLALTVLAALTLPSAVSSMSMLLMSISVSASKSSPAPGNRAESSTPLTMSLSHDTVVSPASVPYTVVTCAELFMYADMKSAAARMASSPWGLILPVMVTLLMPGLRTKFVAGSVPTVPKVTPLPSLSSPLSVPISRPKGEGLLTLAVTPMTRPHISVQPSVPSGTTPEME